LLAAFMRPPPFASSIRFRENWFPAASPGGQENLWKPPRAGARSACQEVRVRRSQLALADWPPQLSQRLTGILPIEEGESSVELSGHLRRSSDGSED
jgi:hypothetical protein